MLISIDTDDLEKACARLVKTGEGVATVTIVITYQNGNCVAFTAGAPGTAVAAVVEGLRTTADMMELPRVKGLPTMNRGN